MTPDLTLARQLTALDSFAWAAGMLVYCEPDDLDAIPSGITTTAGDNPRVVGVRDGCVTLAWESGAGDAEGGTLLRGDLPDLDDAATGGALLCQLGINGWRISRSANATRGAIWRADIDPALGIGSWHTSLGRACAAVLIALGGVR